MDLWQIVPRIVHSRLSKGKRRCHLGCIRRLRSPESLESRRVLATLVVTLASDAEVPTDSDSGITLREAIKYVNGEQAPDGDKGRFDYANLGTNDKIVFSPDVFGPNGITDTIELIHGGLTIINPVTIEWAGAGFITIDASTYDPFYENGIFNISTPFEEDVVTLEGLKLTGSHYGAINASNSLTLIAMSVTDNTITTTTLDKEQGGAGIRVIGSGNSDAPILRISNSEVSYNSAMSDDLNAPSTYGGGILARAASLVMENTKVHHNTADGFGGGIAIVGSYFSSYSLDRSNVYNNSVSGPSTSASDLRLGGGLFLRGITNGVSVKSSSFTFNEAVDTTSYMRAHGGAIYASMDGNSASLTSIANSTISNNTAEGDGGGMYATLYGVINRSYFRLESTTVYQNTASNGAGLYSGIPSLGGSTPPLTTLYNSIIAGNKTSNNTANNIYGDINPASSFNLLADGGSGNLIDGVRGNILVSSNDPKLGGLSSSEDASPHHTPLTNSPAVDHGDPAEVYSSTAFDQIGGVRVLDSVIDIGAIETSGNVLPTQATDTADIVLLVDRSGSSNATIKDYIADITLAIDSELAGLGYFNNRYAVVGFGDGTLTESGRGFTYLFNGDDFTSKHAAAQSLNRIDYEGGSEDGWDAMEHAISELTFRSNVPAHFVLFTDDSRYNSNANLTGDNSESASIIARILATRNASLTVMTSSRFEPHGLNDRVFGVLPDSGSGHISIEYNDDYDTINLNAFNESFDDYNTFVNSEFAPGAENQYVKLAWGTGGSAWNATIFFDEYWDSSIQSPVPQAPASGVLRFIDAFAKQVAVEVATQQDFHPSRIKYSANFGNEPYSVPAFVDAPPSVGSSFAIGTISSNPSKSIPIGTENAFTTYAVAGSEQDLLFSIPVSAPGNYDVELYFAEPNELADRVFDILLEGELALNDFEIMSDWSKVELVSGFYDLNGYPLTPELPGVTYAVPRAAGAATPVVKTFRIEVSGSSLEVALIKSLYHSDSPLLNAIRVRSADEVWQLGDFTDNGYVDAGDYSYWRDRYNPNAYTVVAPHTQADHDGDGLVTKADYNIWSSNYGRVTGKVLGDFNNDGKTNAADYAVWTATYGSTTDLRADGNYDGVVNSADYTLWRDTFGSTLTVAEFGLVAQLAADFNQDGFVDDADLALWQAEFGSAGTYADANGDNTVDFADFDIWQRHYGATTFDDIAGDFNSDGVVDTLDYDLWANGDLLADANSDSVVDQDDYDIWEAHLGTFRASLLPELGPGGSGPLKLAGLAPMVLDVVISNSGASPYSFAGVVGTGEQLRSLPVAGAKTVSITFSEEVFVTQNALLLTNLDGTSPSTVTDFSYDQASRTASWTFASAFADGRTLLTLSDSVFDLDHDALDGDFYNAWSLADTLSGVFGTGDGDAGGEFRFHFTVLSGDTTGGAARDNVAGATNYTNWASTEPGAIYVSMLTDEFDANLAFGDVSLREAVYYANTSTTPITVYLPVGRIMITRAGSSESDSTHDIAYNDMNILSDVRVVGAGPGLSVIDLSGLVVNAHRRAFDVASGGNSLEVNGVTIANGDAYYAYEGVAAKVGAGSSLTIKNSAIVNNFNLQYGTGVYSVGGDLTVRRTVFTNNESVNQGGQAIHAITDGATAGSLTIGESLFALNQDWTPSGPYDPNVLVAAGVALFNEGKNLFDDATGGFFDTTPGIGDYLGVPDYVVTTLADSFTHGDDLESLSVREAVDRANQAAGSDEIWLPAWRFTLTRDRQTYGGGSPTDMNTGFGDLDVSGSLVVRGVRGRTSIEWKPGVIDKVFELLGDYNEDGIVTAALDGPIYQATRELGSGTYVDWEAYAADGEDDGDVDEDDLNLLIYKLGNTLTQVDVAT